MCKNPKHRIKLAIQVTGTGKSFKQKPEFPIEQYEDLDHIQAKIATEVLQVLARAGDLKDSKVYIKVSQRCAQCNGIPFEPFDVSIFYSAAQIKAYEQGIMPKEYIGLFTSLVYRAVCEVESVIWAAFREQHKGRFSKN